MCYWEGRFLIVSWWAVVVGRTFLGREALVGGHIWAFSGHSRMMRGHNETVSGHHIFG